MLDFKELTLAMGKLEDEKVVEIITDFVKSCPSKQEALEVLKICQLSMDMVGKSYEKGEYFVADLIFAGKLLTMSIDILKPVLCNQEEFVAGKILIGTVQGDLHDIGKNIFTGLAKTVGFELFDLGIDVAVETFVEKAKIVKPDIIGLSGILTMAIDSMKGTVDGLKEAGIEAKIIIGGVPVSEATCAYIGADAFTNNAAEGVKICQDWMQLREIEN
ncbi:cobalamin B12-binding domain-containing protein [Acetobacterium woodii]|uniref:Corrinoid protein MttC15 n=1 Tax=Acetobacterium woodii (strain ATCC 29683 / DSM 1030 / JCM 2381 / KCTC 1655 / WB1) TaxID=931626 RepID=H6LH94_ACEWD|nr:cobalamin-dependent protein [Acetobacterium woodii]AFA48432.1 corrinoid protein MttC15 [Acetobacterium woodii DSM 1030]